jgi:hypothetical protein
MEPVVTVQDTKKRPLINARIAILYAVPALLICLSVIVAIGSRGKTSIEFPQLLLGVIFALVGGSASGVAVATLLARQTKAQAKATKESVASSRKRAELTPPAPLSLDDSLENLPEIDRDRARVAAMYGVNTVRDLAEVDDIKRAQLIGAFGRALFARAHKIASDCKSMGSHSPQSL